MKNLQKREEEKKKLILSSFDQGRGDFSKRERG